MKILTDKNGNIKLKVDVGETGFDFPDCDVSNATLVGVGKYYVVLKDDDEALWSAPRESINITFSGDEIAFPKPNL